MQDLDRNPQRGDVWEDLGLRSGIDRVIIVRTCEYENLHCDGPIDEHVHVSSLSGRTGRTILQRHFNGRRFSLVARDGVSAG